MQHVLELTIDHLELSVRARNVLNELPITTVSDLSHLSEDDLRRWPECGQHTMREIAKALQRAGGYHLDTEPIVEIALDRFHDRRTLGRDRFCAKYARHDGKLVQLKPWFEFAL